MYQLQLLTLTTVLLSICWARIPDDINERYHYPSSPCFYRPKDDCPKPEEVCRCKQLPENRESVICCDVNQFLLTEGLNCANLGPTGEIKNLHVHNATLDYLNVSQPTWRRLARMSFTDGRIGEVIGEFPKISTVQCLNLSNNAITQIYNRSFVPLYNLSYVDLSHNNISQVPNFQKNIAISLDISSNNLMECTMIQHALHNADIDFIRGNATLCQFVGKSGSSNATTSWFDLSGVISAKQIALAYSLVKNCSVPNCTCDPINTFVHSNQQSIFQLEVKCNGSQLTQMPSKLPNNVLELDIRDNNITSLDIINDNPSYHNLRILHAENNKISSIESLEGTNFLSKFQLLNLRYNKLKTLPIYILSNTFERFSNTNPRKLFLGGNYLHCDCHTAKVLKDWLSSRSQEIVDYEEVWCANFEGIKIIDLDPRLVCQSPTDWTDYIYYVIGLEVFLLVSLVLKVSYDYWVFKTAGYLPWPANKMPKLPCDWLCE